MFAGKNVKVFLKGEAKKTYAELQKSKDVTILDSFERIKDIVKENPQYGNPIKKERIPQALKQLGIHNLYRAQLANYWRMLYTVEGTPEKIFVFILAIIDHKEYDKLFGYKKK